MTGEGRGGEERRAPRTIRSHVSGSCGTVVYSYDMSVMPGRLF